MTTDIELHLDPRGDLVAQLVDQILILTTEAQTLFAERYASYSWKVDLADDQPVFWFERKPAAIFRPHFVGSTSGASNTWLWGWENINGFPDSVVEVAEQLREIADQFDAEELTTAQLPLDPAERASAGLLDRAEYSYVYAAMAVSGLNVPVFYRGPTGSGSFAWFILDNEAEFDLPAPSPSATIGAITRALDSGLLTDHRLAVRSYAARRSDATLTEGDADIELTTPSGTVLVSFDAQGRIESTQASMASAPTDAVSAEPAARIESARPSFLGRLLRKGR